MKDMLARARSVCALTLGLAVGGGAILLPTDAHAQYEGAAFGVNKFNGSGECACHNTITLPFPPFTEIEVDCDNLTYAGAAAVTFNSALVDMAYNTTQSNANKGVDPEDWVDNSISYGNDDVSPFGTDFADVVFLSTHGHYDCDASPKYSGFVMGETHSGQTCTPRTNYDIKLGDVDTDGAFFISCSSAQRCVWNGGGYDRVESGQFTIWAGFHGDSYDMQDNIDRLEDYMADTKSSNIGDYWIDYMTDLEDVWDPIPYDQCATTIVYGSSPSVRRGFSNTGGFKDLHGTGEHTGSTFSRLSPCDPYNGEPL
jgi:hypothetical protein